MLQDGDSNGRCVAMSDNVQRHACVTESKVNKFWLVEFILNATFSRS